MLGMIHEEAAAGLTCLTHACACEILVREGRLTTLDLPTELLIDGLRKVKIACSLSNFLCQILNPKNQSYMKIPLLVYNTNKKEGSFI